MPGAGQGTRPMPKRIVIIQGHPDPSPERFCRALGAAYAEGAAGAGHEVRHIDVAALDIPILRTKEDFDSGTVPDALRPAQEAITWAGHLVFIYPLWLGGMPALLKVFLEQVMRPGFAFELRKDGLWKKLLKGRSARIVATMGMPAFMYRWVFGAHSLRSLERNILGFCGIGPIRESLIGMVEAGSGRARVKWIGKVRQLGKKGI